MKKIVFQSFLGIILLVLLSLTSVMAQTTSSVVKFSVLVRNDVKVEMGATVIANPISQRGGNTILVLSGTSQTSENFTALAKSVLASDANVSRMILLDYPGHGQSGFPVSSTSDVRFGDLTMDDYVTVLLRSLEVLRINKGFGTSPNSILAHSLGAELIQMLQTKLVEKGTSLREEFGIKSAIFIASDIPSPLEWAAIDAGAADDLAYGFVREDENLGIVFDLLTLPGGPETWIALFYRDRSGNIVPGAPTPDEALSNRLISLESGSMAKQLIGLPDFPGGPRYPRPKISKDNIFSPKRGTLTSVVTLEQDGLFSPGEHKALYNFITGDSNFEFFFTFTGPTTVHNVQTIEPKIYNEVIKKVLAAAQNTKITQ